jgi:hypothetical protein
MDIEAALKDNRTSQAAIGLTKDVFESLLPMFEASLPMQAVEKQTRVGHPYKLRTDREKLFFILYYLKNYPTYDVLGVEFGMHRSNAFRNVNKYMSALKSALSSCKAMPSASIDELNKKLKNVHLIIVDGTEQPRNRPKDREKQKKYYSGKKNATQ